MCTIVAKKYKDKWGLYKIRDRNYDPDYKLHVQEQGDLEILFLEDQINKWSECLNSEGLMMVSATLDNHFDAENNDINDPKIQKMMDERNEIIKKQISKIMSTKNIDKAKDLIVKEKFTGTTFLSDTKKLYVIEIYMNDKAKKEVLEKEAQKRGIQIDDFTRVEQELISLEKLKDYDVGVKEIKKDDLVVRTNHGVILDDAGYQPPDEGYESSEKRRKITIKALKPELHPIDVMYKLRSLYGIEPKKQNNPIRLKEKKPDGRYKYYSTSIVGLFGTTMMFIPLQSTLDDTEEKKIRLKKERKVDFIILPNKPLFESFNLYLKKRKIL
jgi:hypothetical protein